LPQALLPPLYTTAIITIITRIFITTTILIIITCNSGGACGRRHIVSAGRLLFLSFAKSRVV
jgi:hypothetical protein